MASEEGSTASQPNGRRSHGRTLLLGGAAVFVVQVLALGAGSANQLMLARLLSPEQLAAFFLTLSVVEVAALLGQMGLERPVTRLLAQANGAGHLDAARGVLARAVPLCTLASAVVVAGYVGGVGPWLASDVFESPIMASGTLVAGIWLVSLSFQTVTGAALRGLHRVGQAALYGGALQKLLMAGVLAALLWRAAPQQLVPVLWIAVVTTGLSVAAGFAVLGGIVGRGPVRRADTAVLVRAALPLLLTGLVWGSVARADLWIVGVLFSGEQVALYGAAKRLIVLVAIPLTILNLVVPPVIADLYARGDVARLQPAIRGAATLAGLPALALLLLFALASEEVLGLAFGEFYRDASVVLVLLSIERFVFVWVGPCGLTLMMTGHERPMMNVTLATGVFTVATVSAGATLGGFPGVAGGFLIGSATNQVLTWYTALRMTGIRTDVDLRNMGSMIDALKRIVGR